MTADQEARLIKGQTHGETMRENATQRQQRDTRTDQGIKRDQRRHGQKEARRHVDR